MSSVVYAEAAGVTDPDMVCAFTIGVLHLSATRVLKGDILYGDSAALVGSTWSPFNGRYRTWERFVKYSRLLQRSSSSKAAKILDNASSCRVFTCEHFTLEVPPDILWSHCINPEHRSHLGLSSEVTKSYRVPPRGCVLRAPGVSPPILCRQCTSGFKSAIEEYEDDEVYAISGLPAAVVNCESLGIASGIRRAAVWATKKVCCDDCACKVTCWADQAAYLVLVSLMKSEPDTDAVIW
ncbi:hypothetical protein HYALB_00013196 [Hymenoscyphus albidus]|uniref:Uncharacterized protein n=1 Tax=Hymenoscyphus albidus TaxID=595503 RepID=A0A9N9LSP8_9HELO|nr:hypothetical protein HYALB_00013196 [Hymenoscyphus albidus]